MFGRKIQIWCVNVFVWLEILYISLRESNRRWLGEKVKYKGNVYTITNGVSPVSWTLRLNPNGLPDVEAAPRNECETVNLFKSVIHRIKSAYIFYMGYWHSVWVSRIVYPES